MGLVELNKEIELVVKTIESANSILKCPSTALDVKYADQFTKALQKTAPKLAMQFQKTIGKGRIEEAIIGGACLGAAWVVAKGVDVTKETIAKNKAREQLIGLYQELSVKQNLLIDEQQQIIYRLDSEKNLLQEEQAKLKRELVIISNAIAEIRKVQEKRSV